MPFFEILNSRAFIFTFNSISGRIIICVLFAILKICNSPPLPLHLIVIAGATGNLRVFGGQFDGWFLEGDPCSSFLKDLIAKWLSSPLRTVFVPVKIWQFPWWIGSEIRWTMGPTETLQSCAQDLSDSIFVTWWSMLGDFILGISYDWVPFVTGEMPRIAIPTLTFLENPQLWGTSFVKTIEMIHMYIPIDIHLSAFYRNKKKKLM